MKGGGRQFGGGNQFYEDGRFQRQGFEQQPFAGEGFYESDFYESQYDRQQQPGQAYEQQFQRGGDSNRGGLGVALSETGGRGAQVADVYRNSPADRVGIRQGDRIIEVDGQRVASVRELQSIISQHDPREQVEIVLLRNGRERVIRAQLESRREALSQGQRSFQGGQGFQPGSQFGQFDQRRVEARLASLERQMQQILSDVRMLRRQMGATGDRPEPPRQVLRPQTMEDRSGFRDSQGFQGQQNQSGSEYQDERREDAGYDF